MDIGGIISAIIVGLIIGALGRLLAPGKQRISILLTLVVGVVAAFVGSALAVAIGVGATAGFDWIELLIQVVLAAVGVSALSKSRGR